MAPLISPKDEILIEKFKTLKVNDIVVIKKNNRGIICRVTYVPPNKQFVITKGDSLRLTDGKVKMSQVVGLVKEVIREGEKISILHTYHLYSSIYISELEKINKLFLEKKIKYGILKGLPVYLHYLNRIPKRFYFDTDILIFKTQKKDATNLLATLGYKKQPSKLYGKIIRNSTEMNMFKFTPPFATRVDLHLDPGITFTKLHVFNQFLPKTKGFTQFLRKSFRETRVENTSFPILKLEPLICYLLLHFYRHNYQGSHRLELIDAVIRKNKVDWKKLTQILKSFELESLTFPAILMLKDYYKTPFPKKFFKEVTPQTSKKLFAFLIEKMLSPFDQGTKAQEGAKRYILILALSPLKLSKRIRILFLKETWIYFVPTIKFLALSSFKKLLRSFSALTFSTL